MNLCVPLTNVFRSCAHRLLPIVVAVSFKEPSDEYFPGKAHFLECSLNIADVDFPANVERMGLLDALRSGKYESFACDIGPNCPTKRDYSRNGFPRAVPAGGAIPDDVYLERATRNIRWLRGEFGGYVHAENLNYFPTGAYERVCEPTFIRRVTEDAGIGLLLDVAHAIISARHLGYEDAFAYIRDLPLERVREMHLSHPGDMRGVFEDLHEPPGEDEVAIVGRLASGGVMVEYLTVEYYGNPDLLCGLYRGLASGMWLARGPGLDHASAG